MSTRPDPNTPEVPQEAAGGPQSAPEGASGQRDAPEGQNRPQTGAQSLQGEQQPRGPVDWARQQATKRQAREAKARCETEKLKSTLDAVRTIAAELFVAGRSQSERAAGRRLLNALTEPAHDAGPSVREAAAQDAAHWNDKYAGEGL